MVETFYLFFKLNILEITFQKEDSKLISILENMYI